MIVINATPLMMPRRKPVPAPPVVEVAYTTTTGDKPRPDRAHRAPAGRGGYPQDYLDSYDAHCFVCRRHTNHGGEHDDLVEAGLASYGPDGSVYRTEKWDADEAKRISDATYRTYMIEAGLAHLLDDADTAGDSVAEEN